MAGSSWDMAGSWWGITGSWWGKSAHSKRSASIGLRRGGASGGVGAEEQAGERSRAEGEEDRVGGDLRLHAGDLELAADHADEHAGEAAEQRDQHGLGEELREDVAASGADRLADADLARALGDATRA